VEKRLMEATGGYSPCCTGISGEGALWVFKIGEIEIE
jgi:hypothetical protein